MYSFIISLTCTTFLILDYILAGIWMISEILLYKKISKDDKDALTSNTRYPLVFTIIILLSIIVTIAIKGNLGYDEKLAAYLTLTAAALGSSIVFNARDL